jgi:hypothetical protein
MASVRCSSCGGWLVSSTCACASPPARQGDGGAKTTANDASSYAVRAASFGVGDLVKLRAGLPRPAGVIVARHVYRAALRRPVYAVEALDWGGVSTLSMEEDWPVVPSRCVWLEEERLEPHECQSQAFPLDQLPVEVLAVVLRLLPVLHGAVQARTSRKFCRAFRDNKLWRSVAAQRLALSGDEVERCFAAQSHATWFAFCRANCYWKIVVVTGSKVSCFWC